MVARRGLERQQQQAGWEAPNRGFFQVSPRPGSRNSRQYSPILRRPGPTKCSINISGYSQTSELAARNLPKTAEKKDMAADTSVLFDGGEVNIRLDVVYATARRCCDCGAILRAGGRGPFPVHRSTGRRVACLRSRALKPWDVYLAQHGTPMFAIQYRVADALENVSRGGLRCRQRHPIRTRFASELDIDPNRLALLGSSAGAHVAHLPRSAETRSCSSRHPANGHAAVPPAVKAFVGPSMACTIYLLIGSKRSPIYQRE